MPAGIAHWQFGRFDIFCVNPPLVRLWATIPVVASQPQTYWKSYDERPGARCEFDLGTDFIESNGITSFWYFTIARWMCIPFSIVGALVCYVWADRLYGGWAGVSAACLWCFCPNVISSAQSINPDAAAASFGAMACYLFWRWMRLKTWLTSLGLAVALALALLCKTTWVILLLGFPLAFVASCAWTDARSLRTYWTDSVALPMFQLIVAIVLALYGVNLTYAFVGTGTRLGSYDFQSKLLSGASAGSGNRFRGSVLGEIPIPLPKHYVIGIDIQKSDFERKSLSYLRGELRRGGWYHYYLYALLVKTPLGTLILSACAVFVATKRNGRGRSIDDLFVLIPVVAILVLVSAQTGINKHFRYILPLLPFAFVWTSRVFAFCPEEGVPWRIGMTALLAWTIISSLSVLPHSLSYFNEVAGGPMNGHSHLLTSNIDYGQDILLLKRWLDSHPDARPVHLACWVRFDPRVAGIEFSLPPVCPVDEQGMPVVDTLKPEDVGPLPGWHVISVNFLRGYQARAPDGKGSYVTVKMNEYSYFREFEPVATSGYSLYIYHITVEEANAVRGRLGLPLLIY